MQQIFNYNLISGVAPNGQPRSILVSSDGRLLVDGSGVAQPVTIATLPALATGTNTIGAISNTSFAATQSGTWNITNISGTVSLPTGASTSALQTTGNTSLASIDTKTPALGQALAAASTPVVLPAAMVTDLKSVGITGTLPAFAATPTVNIGTAPSLTFTNTSFTANAGTNLNTSALALESGGNLAGINTKLPSGLTVTATRLLTDGSGVTQPVSIATLPALASGTNTIGAISNTSFAATQSGTWNITNISGTVSLPTGASTSALQTTGNTSLASIDTKTPALGQALAAASTPVVLPAAMVTDLKSVSITGTLPAFAATPTVNIGTAPAGLAYESTVTITRAANTTTYAVNDVYGNSANAAFQLTNIGASGGYVFLNYLGIIFNITALPAGMGAFALYLYSATPPSAIADNGAFNIPAGDTASILNLNGIILTASLARGGGRVVAEALNINQLFKLAAGQTSLWGYLVTTAAFTPAANSETATITARSFAP